MGKGKKVTEKVKLFYRGIQPKPSKIVNEDEMQIIIDALKSCVPKKDRVFNCELDGTNTTLKLSIGLSSSLRCLKQKRTKALIYDDTAGLHLRKYLNEFTNTLGIPVVQAHGLFDLAPQLNLKTLLVVSIVEPTSNEKPTPIGEIITSHQFNSLVQLLFDWSRQRRPKQEIFDGIVERSVNLRTGKKRHRAELT